jgi:hypothetical protein
MKPTAERMAMASPLLVIVADTRRVKRRRSGVCDCESIGVSPIRASPILVPPVLVPPVLVPPVPWLTRPHLTPFVSHHPCLTHLCLPITVSPGSI